MSPLSKFIIIVLVLTLSVVFLSSYKSKAQLQSQSVETLQFQGQERAIIKKRFQSSSFNQSSQDKGTACPIEQEVSGRRRLAQRLCRIS